jgi:hypothetical protein
MVSAMGIAIVGVPVVVSAQARVEGVVLDSLRTGAALAGATVVLVEQNRYATSDAQGRFRFDNVPHGRATLGVLHPLLDSLDLQLPPTAVDVAVTGAVVTVTIPPAVRMYAQLCTGGRDSDGGVIVGRVRDIDDGTPIAGAAVATEWVEYTVVSGRSTPKGVATAARSDAKGMFVLCNVPTQVPLSVRVRHNGAVAGPSRVTLDDRLLGRTELGMSFRDTAAQHVSVMDSIMTRDDVRGTAALRGRIMRADNSPAAFAAIGVLGTGRVTRADSTGTFSLDGIPAGTRTIDMRAIGSAPQQQSLDFTTGSTRDTNFVLAPPVQTLAAVKTSRSRPAGFELAGFYDRRKMGFGAFMTEEEIKRLGVLELKSVLFGMRGVRFPGGLATGMPMLRGYKDPCVPAFFLDGIRFRVEGATGGFSYSDLEGFIPIQYVKGIEVYASIATTPLEYFVREQNCGSILIWTY